MRYINYFFTKKIIHFKNTYNNTTTGNGTSLALATSNPIIICSTPQNYSLALASFHNLINFFNSYHSRIISVVNRKFLNKRRIQNTEYRIQNTEYRIQNTEYKHLNFVEGFLFNLITNKSIQVLFFLMNHLKFFIKILILNLIVFFFFLYCNSNTC